jgi:hypothetical protein
MEVKNADNEKKKTDKKSQKTMHINIYQCKMNSYIYHFHKTKEKEKKKKTTYKLT